jgi:ribA/ribD-fused uncharacterized protein
MSIDFAAIADRQEWERSALPEEIARRDFFDIARITERRPVCIAGFHGGYADLSNFGSGQACYDGEWYPSREHAFNAGKTLDLEERRYVAGQGTPYSAKKAGRRVALRDGWDDAVRYQVMHEVVDSCFRRNEGLRKLLLGTQDDLLVERTGKQSDGNWIWHDQVWGWCSCPQHRSWPGQNALGRTLMRIRGELRGDPPDRWVRVMCTGHRDQHLDGEQRAWMNDQLDRIAAKLITDYGMRIAIHGGAIGADLAWARAADLAGVEALWAYLPFPQQPDKWNETQRRAWREYATLRDADEPGRATRVEYLAQEFSVAALHARSDWMIRDSDAVVAVHDPEKATGGTAKAVSKVGQSKPVIWLNPRARTVKIRNPDVYQPAPPAPGGPATLVHAGGRYDVYIGPDTRWANPFSKPGCDPAAAVAEYRTWVLTQPDLLTAIGTLRGKRLGCYCSPRVCHGDVITTLANGGTP